jgi:hypothetical protein
MNRAYRIVIDDMADGSTRYRVMYSDGGRSPLTARWRYVANFGGAPSFEESSEVIFDFRCLADAKAEIDRDISMRKSVTVVNQTVVEYP